MPLQTLDQFTSRVSDLPDKPNTQMTAAELKAQFDAAPEELRQKYNAMVNVLKSSASGDSGAENIGATSISGVSGNTVQSQMSDIFTQLQQVVLGQLPNKSITREKFADGAVDFSPVQKEIANLNLQLQASQLVPSGKTYGWNPTTSFGVIVDFTRGKTTAQLNAGDTSLDGKVTMSEGTFTAGKRVTVLGRNPLDNSIVKEEATITGVSPLTISPLVNSYKAGAWIKRTTASNTASGLKFGGVDDSVINSVTDSTVINQAYDTSGNGGRKLVQLSNGWLVAAVYDSSAIRVVFLVSKDNGANWTQLTFSSVSGAGGFSIASKGTNVYLICTPNGGTTIMFVKFDAVTVTNTAQTSTNIDSGQSSTLGVSLAINEAGTELHAAWASKNGTYPSSFNIRYAKGTINADGSVTWGAVEQRTTANTSGQNGIINPSIILNKNGYPVILTEQDAGSSAKRITAHVYNGSTWTSYIVYEGGSYTQSSPSAIFVPQSVNGLANGRIWVAWHGTDSTDTTKQNIRASYSDDGGVTWSTMQKLTTGNTNNNLLPTLTANKSNEVFILWHEYSTVYTVKQIKNTAGTWGSISVATSGTGEKLNPSSLFDSTFSMDFSSPLFIYQNASTKVGFYGTWTIGSIAPITENTLRFTLTQQAKEVMTYLKHTAGLIATAKVNGTVMDKTTTSEESQFTSVLGSTQDIEVEITLSRATVNEDITIDKILGGVA